LTPRAGSGRHRGPGCGGKKVVIFGANLAQQCIAGAPVDEIFSHLLPVPLGDAIRLFGRPGAAPVDLEAVSVTRAGQMTNLGFHALTGQGCGA